VVDFRNLRLELVAVAFRQAAGDDQGLAAPLFLNWAISRMASTDSCLALSMKAQVLTTSTSADSGSRVSSCPACWAKPSITSESTRFLGQPSETIPIFMRSISVPRRPGLNG
jgi:hypothetical protein